MTSNDKTLIYNLLKTASDNIHGYNSSSFPKQMPAFTDDIKKNDKLSHTEALKTENTQANVSKNEEISNPFITNTEEKSSKPTMQSIAEKIKQCSRCQLAATRRNTVPGEGVTNPVVLVIGEGPGADEDATGRPFVGPAGQLLDKMLAAISLDRHKNCFITNVVKCRPPHNRDPEMQESDACRSFLEAQIAILKPTMILSVGRIASQNLLKTETGIGRLRNTFHDVQGIPTLCTYHPSALLRNEDLKRPAWEDLKLFRSKLETLVPNYTERTGDFFTTSKR